MAPAIPITIWIILAALIAFTMPIHGEPIMMGIMDIARSVSIIFTAHFTEMALDGIAAITVMFSTILTIIGAFTAHLITIIIGDYIRIITLIITEAAIMEAAVAIMALSEAEYETAQTMAHDLPEEVKMV